MNDINVNCASMNPIYCEFIRTAVAVTTCDVPHTKCNFNSLMTSQNLKCCIRKLWSAENSGLNYITLILGCHLICMRAYSITTKPHGNTAGLSWMHTNCMRLTYLNSPIFRRKPSFQVYMDCDLRPNLLVHY